MAGAAEHGRDVDRHVEDRRQVGGGLARSSGLRREPRAGGLRAASSTSRGRSARPWVSFRCRAIRGSACRPSAASAASGPGRRVRPLPGSKAAGRRRSRGGRRRRQGGVGARSARRPRSRWLRRSRRASACRPSASSGGGTSGAARPRAHGLIRAAPSSAARRRAGEAVEGGVGDPRPQASARRGRVGAVLDVGDLASGGRAWPQAASDLASASAWPARRRWPARCARPRRRPAARICSTSSAV